MDDITSTGALIAQGLSHADLRELSRSGTLTPIRRGAYQLGPVDPDEDDPGGYLAHRRQIDANLLQCGADAVLCHGSAAVVHGLPIWRHAITQVHVMRDGNSGGQRRAHVYDHRTPLSADDIVQVEDLVVTSLARTVADLGRSLPLMESVPVGDQALRLGLKPHELQRTLGSMKRWPGVCNARRMADFLDIRSESAGESASRVRMVQDGIPAPELQRVILDEDGIFVARVDFAWEDRRTVGEFDGAVKYGALLKPGQRVADVIEAQDHREDAIRRAGWEVARWGWPQLGEPGEIAARINRAFRRARDRPPHVGPTIRPALF
jgi:hypothetical protein